MSTQKTQYTATVSRNFRDVGSISPKLLLRNITDSNGNLFRDHCWVELDYLAHVVPNSNRYSAKISFEATTKPYYSGKHTLTAISNARYLGKIR